jgi:uncharacterized membrane protein YkoI
MKLENTRRKFLQVMMLTFGVVTNAIPSFADDGEEHEQHEEETEQKDDNESISKEQKTIDDASKADLATPLVKLISHLNKNYPGEILNVGLVQKNKQYIYKIKILTSDGKILKLKLDAKTLARL